MTADSSDERPGLYERWIRPLLFKFDPEFVHQCAIATSAWSSRIPGVGSLVSKWFGFEDSRLAMDVAGLHFANPVGLAAGFDKNGIAAASLENLGFGSIEVGSVSKDPSAGNPKPRLFRLPLDEAVVVNYGVPNDGAPAIAGRLQRRRPRCPLGVNLVETNSREPASVDEVIEQFVFASRQFTGIADYLAFNLNCPNTTGGKSPFLEAANLRRLLEACTSIDRLPPVFLKITANPDPAFIDAILGATEPFAKVRGFIFNVPPGKPYALKTPAAKVAAMPGAACGRPTRDLINQTVREWYRRMNRQRYRLIGVGGIFSARDAFETMALGASLVQIYTSLVYRGPAVVRRIKEGLCCELDTRGLKSISEAIGIHAN